MASVEGSNEVEFPDRGAGFCAGRGGHARSVHLVYLVNQVCLAYLVGLIQLNKRDRPDRLGQTLYQYSSSADESGILLMEWEERRRRPACMHG